MCSSDLDHGVARAELRQLAGDLLGFELFDDLVHGNLISFAVIPDCKNQIALILTALSSFIPRLVFAAELIQQRPGCCIQRALRQ